MIATWIESLASVYPRVDGGTGDCHLEVVGIGLSPRGRGNPSTTLHQYLKSGSIPAWTGEPVAIVGIVTLIGGVYPRVDGGTVSQPVAGRRGSIPAWTGEPCR